jgi:hypothetical protein
VNVELFKSLKSDLIFFVAVDQALNPFQMGSGEHVGCARSPNCQGCGPINVAANMYTWPH